MKTRNFLLTALAILSLAMLSTPATQAQTCDGTGTNFVDLDGDGFNDNAPDHDGDGIPNGIDDDYIKNAKDGQGYKNGPSGKNQGQGMAQNRSMTKSQKFNRLHAANGNMFQRRMGGMNGSGTGVCDGSGGGMNGSGTGTGVCDGSGPNGGQRRGGGGK